MRAILVFICVAISWGKLLGESASKKDDSAYENFVSLSIHYQKWNEGLFGSRRYREGRLRRLCVSLIGKGIETDIRFRMVSPQSLVNPGVEVPFRDERWLEVTGPVDRKSVAKFAGNDVDKIRAWWRRGPIVAISGIVRDCRLSRNIFGDSVVLKLRRITIVDWSLTKKPGAENSRNE